MKLYNLAVVLYQLFFAEEVRLRNDIERNYQLVISNNDCASYIMNYYEACVRYEYFKTINAKVIEFLRMSDL